MNKKELRKQYLKLRKTIYDKELKSKEIINKIISLDKYKKAKIIALYNSHEDEVNTQDLIKYSLENNKIVALPRVINKTEMNFYKITSLDELERGTFGICEPIEKEDNLVQPNEIDLMIVPGICFDRNKNRIGFGGGYYDRYLSKRKDIFKIGVCFEKQLVSDNEIEVRENDVKMNIVMTEKKVYGV